MSVAKPISFDKQLAQREKVVKQQLLQIRDAENNFFRRYGHYTASFDSLTAQHFLADSLRYIPFSDGKQFKLVTSSYLSSSGKPQSLMMCSARYDDYLYGLDENNISTLTDEANQQGNFPGLKFGDLTAPNGNAASWE